MTRWLKQVGDEVAVDEPLLEVSTDKVDTEIPSPVAGTLLEIKVEEDETVEVGAELAIIGSGDDAPAQAEPEAQPQDEEQAEKKAEQEEQVAEETGELPPGDETPESEKKQEVEPEARGEAPNAPAPEGEPEPQRDDAAAAKAPAQSDGGRDQTAYVTPLVRKMADQHGVDLGSVQGTGVGGRIRKQDVLDAAAAAKEAAAPAPAAAPAAPAAAAPAAVGTHVVQPLAAARHHRAALPPAQGHRRRGWSESLQTRPPSSPR